MSLLETSKRCCICKKLFCCADCRKRHENNKHPKRELSCPLCTGQKLPLQVFENREFFCHVVFNHLPLYCCLCGTIFSNSEDLENFGACKWWRARATWRHSLVSEAKSVPGTPLSLLGQSAEIRRNEQFSLESNFVSLTSPPEIFRKTSTPMHVPLPGQKASGFEFKTPSAPNFSLKTPRTDSAASTRSRESRVERSCRSRDNSTAGDTKFVSLSSCEGSHNEKTPFRTCQSSWHDSVERHSRMNSGRKLDVMEEQDENGPGEAEADEDPREGVEPDARGGVDAEDVDATGSQGSLGTELKPRQDSDMDLTGVRPQVDSKDMDLTGARSRVDSVDMDLTGARSRVDSEDMDLTGVRSPINSEDMDLTGARSRVDSEDMNLTGARSRFDSEDMDLTGARSRVGSEDMDLTRARSRVGSEDMDLTGTRSRVGSEDMDLTGVQGLAAPEVDTSAKLRSEIPNVLRLDARSRCGSDGMEQTRPVDEELPSSPRLEAPEPKPSKRVRFSDQQLTESTRQSLSTFNATENEEFFEAQDTVSMSLANRSTRTDDSSVGVYREDKENENPSRTVTGGSSRVVMMVVVENSGSLTNSDLTPIISSSLKKLEERATTLYSSSSNISNQIPAGNVRSVTSVDSYVSVSNVENVSARVPSSSSESPETKASSEGSGNSGGLFSVVAQAVKFALRNLSGTSRSVTRRPSLPRSNDTRTSISETSHNGSHRSVPSLLLARPAKRPRDVGDSSLSSSGTFGSTASLDALVPSNEVTSPVAKRHRGWYRIKAREPIGKMRNSSITSPRGISSETQVFSQGSLSVGDTILPIPSRAHQYTQTE